MPIIYLVSQMIP